MKGALFMAQEISQLFPDDFHHLMGGGQAFENFLSDRFHPNVFNEILNNLEIDVGFQQRQAHLFQGVGDVLFSQNSLAA